MFNRNVKRYISDRYNLIIYAITASIMEHILKSWCIHVTLHSVFKHTTCCHASLPVTLSLCFNWHYSAVYRLCVVVFSLVQLTVQCFIQTVCCGVQFGSAESTVLYTDCVLWRSVCITVCNISLAFTIYLSFKLCVNCTLNLFHLTVQCCVQTLCCGIWFALQFVTFNFLLRHVSFVWLSLSLHWLLINQYILQNYVALYWFCEDFVQNFTEPYTIIN